MNPLTSLNSLQEVKDKILGVFNHPKSSSNRTLRKNEETRENDRIRPIELEDEDNLLIILLLAVLFSVTLPILLITSPCMILDSSVFVLFILLIFLGPITLLVSANMGNLLPEGVNGYF